MALYKKEVAELIKHAESMGFACIGLGGKGHWKLQHTSGRVVTVPATPTGGRSRWRLNAEATMRRIDRTHNDTH